MGSYTRPRRWRTLCLDRPGSYCISWQVLVDGVGAQEAGLEVSGSLPGYYVESVVEVRVDAEELGLHDGAGLRDLDCRLIEPLVLAAVALGRHYFYYYLVEHPIDLRPLGIINKDSP